MDAAYRELLEETGFGRDDVTPLCHLIDFAYYSTERMVEFYVCRLLTDKQEVEEEDGNKLVWVNINGTDFSDNETFAGDGNIYHCLNMAQKYQNAIFSEDTLQT